VKNGVALPVSARVSGAKAAIAATPACEVAQRA
jgi:hypothetical protein